MFRLKDLIFMILWIVNLTYVFPAPKFKDWNKEYRRKKRDVDGGQLPPLPIQGHSINNQQQINNNINNPNTDERSRDYTGTGTRDYQYQYETGGGGTVGSGGYRVVLPEGIDPNANPDQNSRQNPRQNQNSQSSRTFANPLGDTEFQFRSFLQPNGQPHETGHATDQTDQNQVHDQTTRTQTPRPRTQGTTTTVNQRATSGSTQVASSTENTYTGTETRYYNTRTGSGFNNVGSGYQDAARQNGGRETYSYGGNIPVYNQGGYYQGGYNQGGHNRGPYNAGGNNRGAYNPGGLNQGRYNRGNHIAGEQRPIPNVGIMTDDPNCPNSNLRIFINNMECTQAVDTLGAFICYNYERVSRACCEKCLPLKQRHNRGCEYGDRSYQCRNIEPFDCYVHRNREICCDTCRRYAMQRNNTVSGCEYGDLTPRCQTVRDRKHLCYLPENQRLCCITCPSVEDRENPGCRWGDQNPDLCEPFTTNGQVRINCYQPAVRQVCCSTCTRLQSRIDNDIPGCEYGDKPVRFNTVRGMLDCGNYVRFFGIEACDIPDVNTHCCHTCYRYRLAIQRG